MVRLLVVSSLCAFALGCGPQTGSLSQSAKFHFDVYPPVTWTYTNATDITKTGLKPAATVEEASTQVKKDINEAVTSTMAEYGANGAQITVSYDPLGIARLDSKCADDATSYDGYYGYFGDTIFYACKNMTFTDYAVTEGTVTVTSPLLLYQSQWDSLAVKVQKKLSAKNVVFDEPVHQIP